MFTEIDATANPVSVTTYGSAGQQIARSTWPDLPSALAFANRMTALCGGELLVSAVVPS